MSVFNGSIRKYAVKLLTNYLPVSSNPCGEIQFGFLSNNPDDQVIGRVDYDLN
ncbi:MAG: hypothetical protein ABSE46_05390 [Terracidiphilus sp.]